MKRLPSVYEIGHNFANVDITREPIPVVPTIHYQMGGIPTNIHGQVVVPKDGDPNTVVNGFYAVGECACVSVHGANRLGTNSLLDLLVFGRAAGHHIVESALKEQGAQAAAGRCRRAGAGAPGAPRAGDRAGEYAQDVANDIRETMQQHAGVFRTQASMDEGVAKIAALARARRRHRDGRQVEGVQHRAHRGARGREPDRMRAGDDGLGRRAQGVPRRAHRRDYERPADDAEHPLGRNDREWMKHTLWYRDGNRLDYKPVQLKPLSVDSVPPKVRTF